MATYRLKEWFLTITGTANKAGTRFKDGDKPKESTFADWFKSSLFKSEPDDRAKEDVAGTTLADINGHVVAATDAQAKANQAKKEDRTVVAQASQLPSVDSTDTLTITSDQGLGYDDQPLNVYKDDSVSTRSNYLIKFRDSFSTWLSTLVARVDALEVAIIVDSPDTYTYVDLTTLTDQFNRVFPFARAYYTYYIPTSLISPENGSLDDLKVILPTPSEAMLGDWGVFLKIPENVDPSTITLGVSIYKLGIGPPLLSQVSPGTPILIKCVKYADENNTFIYDYAITSYIQE